MDKENNEENNEVKKSSPTKMFYIFFIGSLYLFASILDWIIYLKRDLYGNNVTPFNIAKLIFIIWLFIIFVKNAIKYNKERKRLENQD